MKKVGDLMREMGFREDASLGAKEAFIKHLIKAATGVEVETPTEKRQKHTKTWTKERLKPVEGPEQLSFNLDNDPNPKKVG